MDLTVTPKDELTIKLLHYFITCKGYKPIVVHGTKDEIWLENLDNEYKIVRIVNNHIHNNEQYKFDAFKTKKIVSRIKKKTFFTHMNVLNIFTDLGNNVTKIDNNKDITCLNIKELTDFNKYKNVLELYPDISKIEYKEEGVNLFMKLTQEINKTTENDAKKVEKIFTMKKPSVTYILIFINIIAFLAMYIFGYGSTDSKTLIAFGANYYPLVHQGQYYRLITSSFLHIGVLHIACNMYALYIIGDQIENLYGKLKYLIIYFGSALCGSLFSLLFVKNAISAGASGAIFGLLGSMLYFGYYYRIYLGNVISSQIMPVILINLLIGFMVPGVDVSAHIGGLVGGILFSKAVGVKDKSNQSDKINGIILSLIFICFMIYILFIR